MKRSMKLLLTVVTLAALLLPASAFAHREDYADETLVFLTLHRHEMEPEYWFDFGHDAGVDFVRHSLAVEYGLTEHWMVDSRLSWSKPLHEAMTFDSGRLETRYRFFEENTLPVDIAVSGELNNERGDQRREWGFEPRLILSKDFEKMNVTMNLAEEIGLRTHETSFDPSIATRYDASSLVRFGAELRYFTGQHGGAVIPQVAIKLPHDVTLRVAFSYGIGRDRDSQFTRLSGEAGFADSD
jgi:hypothetical protein